MVEQNKSIPDNFKDIYRLRAYLSPRYLLIIPRGET